jgi:hypothetical protein
MILDSMDSITLNQHSYLDLINELDVAKQKALIKLKSEDTNVKAFIESKLYLLLKSNLIDSKNKYDYYLKSVTNYKKVIVKEVFDILMKEG